MRPYGELLGEAVLGPFTLVSRPAAEPRITDDPEWPGRRDLELAWRMAEAYLSAQFKYGSVFYGQMDRNWGPVGIEGIGLSDYGYSDTELGFEIGVDAVRLAAWPARSRMPATAPAPGSTATSSPTGSASGSASGCGSALWETTVLAGADREFDGRYRNPLSLLLLANQYGLGADGNVLFGLDGPTGSARAPRSRPRSASTISSTRTPRARIATPTAGPSPSRPTGPSARGSPGAHCTPRRRVSPSGRSIRSRT